MPKGDNIPDWTPASAGVEMDGGKGFSQIIALVQRIKIRCYNFGRSFSTDLKSGVPSQRIKIRCYNLFVPIQRIKIRCYNLFVPSGTSWWLFIFLTD